MRRSSTSPGNPILLMGIIAFVVFFISACVAYSIWSVRRKLRAQTAQRTEHILRPQSTLDPELELGNPFRKGEFLEDDPFAVPHNIVAYLPSAPPRVHAAGSPRFGPPGLLPCKHSDSARIPLIVANVAGARASLKASIGHTGTFIPEEEAQFNTPRPICPTYFTPSRLPSPPTTPIIPTLVVTSASIQPGSFIKTTRSDSDDIPSPLPTPTLVLTSPSIHCGLDTGMETHNGSRGSVQNWSDAFELEDYVDEDKVSIGPSFESSKQLQTPPQTPTLLQTPLRGSSSSLPSGDEKPPPILQHDDEDTPDSSHSQMEPPEVQFDHAAFHTHTAAFKPAHKRTNIYNMTTCKMQNSDFPVTPSSHSQPSAFDYARILARKRSATVSVKPARPKPLTLFIQVPPRPRHVAWTPPLPRHPGDI